MRVDSGRCHEWTVRQLLQVGGCLHTRLDETDEMTNTGGIPAGPYLDACTMLACLRACLLAAMLCYVMFVMVARHFAETCAADLR